ncbi:hypothetical protein HR060_16770 [Catenovulum sp. SM1970]|uniref:hypothetical protein n=1 Tax=Marinifaba aquimaris TaxID=2741323 RepID=UPI001574A47A|nr:hypothetical protein [Marinifaba aquimaris]NTS78499.1 hypothetical protein [Marinifaba aquimaris]
MNIHASAIGIIVAFAIIIYLKVSKAESHRYTYSLLLLTFPFYYFAFAIVAVDFEALAYESLFAVGFFIIALCSIKLPDNAKFAWLAFGYFLHGLYDLFHNKFFINYGTPNWWPDFCAMVDIILGMYLIFLSIKALNVQPSKKHLSQTR